MCRESTRSRNSDDLDKQQEGIGQEPRRRASLASAAHAFNPFPNRVNYKDLVINVLMGFDSIDTCPNEDDLIPIVIKLLNHHHRMNSIPSGKVGNKHWTFEPIPVDTPIDPKTMIRTVDINCKDIHEMADVIQHESTHCLRSEERKLPWWEFVILSNKGKGQSIIMLRIDHTIGDGFAIGRLCATFITQTKDEKETSEDKEMKLKDFIPQAMKDAKMSKTMFRQDSYFIMIWKLLYAIVTTSLLPFMRADHKTAFSKDFVGPTLVDTHHRKTLFFDPIPLDFIKTLKNTAQCSLNDILIYSLSQAIHDYCKDKDCPALEKYGKGLMCRGAITFGFPNDEINNSWVPLTVDLGLGEKTPRDRLQSIREVTTSLKQSFVPICRMVLTNYVSPYLPLFLYRQIIHTFFSSHTLIISSVPGPMEEVYVAGKPLSRCWFTVRSLTPFFSMLSYNNEINISLVADDTVIEDMDLLPMFYRKALCKLSDEYGVTVPSNVRDVDQE